MIGICSGCFIHFFNPYNVLWDGHFHFPLLHIIPRLDKVKWCAQNHMPRKETNRDANLRVWPWSSHLPLSMVLLHAWPCLSLATPIYLYDFACDDSKIYMSSPNLNPIRFPCSTAYSISSISIFSISETVSPKRSSFYCPKTCSSFHIHCQLTTTCLIVQTKKSGHPSLTSLCHTL